MVLLEMSLLQDVTLGAELINAPLRESGQVFLKFFILWI